jgi:outer membrane lipoprotein-sorting protein
VRNIFTALLSVGLAAATPAFAKELSADEVRAVQSKMQASDYLTVDFVQKSHKAMRNSNTVRNGKAVFARPNKFKWMLETPTPIYMIYDGKAFYDYSVADKAAKRYSMTGPTSDELRNIVDLVLNFDNLLKRYDLEKAEQIGEEVKIQLKPKVASQLTAVELRLSVKDAYITYLKMSQKNKNSLIHEFSNPSHKPVSDDTFQLPQGVKVTDSN